MAADKLSRFVIIDGVQVARERAIRLGLLKAAETETKPAGAPSSSRARSSESARKGGGAAGANVSE